MRLLKGEIACRALLVFAALASAASPVWAGGGGTSPKPLAGAYPIVLAHGLMGWGGDSEGALSIVNYWGGMDDYLRSQGASVLAPAMPPGSSNAARGVMLKEKVLYWMAANGYAKVHYLGHSQGPLGVRYAVSNLGLASKTSSVTSLNGVNRGTGLADALAPLFKPGSPLTGIIETFVDLLYAVDDSDALAVIDSLSTQGMATFNSLTPDAGGVRYYSYGSAINGNIIENPVGSLLYQFTGDNSKAVHGFANDGFVPLSSQKWGTWKGGPDAPFYFSPDHLQCANMFHMGEVWYDVEGYFLKMAKNMKTGQ